MWEDIWETQSEEVLTLVSGKDSQEYSLACGWGGCLRLL